MQIKNKRIIGCVVIGIVLIGMSFLLYGKNNDKVFKDKYMENIFVEENQENNDGTLVNKDNNESEKKDIVVEIKGEVLKPDVYVLEEGSIIKDLIDKAGGLTSDGDTSKINRADVLKSHQLVLIPNKNDINNDSQAQGNSIDSSIPESTSGLININTATLEQLREINGIGETKAKNILNYRESNGGFKTIEDIKNVDGIGEKTYEKLKDQITC